MNNWQQCWNQYSSPRHSSRSTLQPQPPPKTSTQLRLNSVPAFILFVSVATGNEPLFWITCFCLFMQTYFNLASTCQRVCIGNCKVLFSPPCVSCFHAFAHLCFVLLCFGYCTCSECTWEQHGVFTASVFCVVVLFTSCKREEGEGGGGAQRLPGEEEVVSNEVTPWQPNDSSQSAPPSLPPPSFHLAPSECAHPLKPPPPDRESCPWCWKQKYTSRLLLQCSCKGKAGKTHETTKT